MHNFAAWYEINYIEGFHLDKDIICPDCKMYSPENCAFVPREINNLLTLRKNDRGVSPIGVNKRGKGYRVTITQNKKQVYLGSYLTPEEAFEAYKTAKEKHIKEVADKWKDKIDLKIYEALLSYKINITD